MEKEQITGKFDELKGKAKEAIGHVTDNPKLQTEGVLDEAKGKLKQAFGNSKEAVKDSDHTAGTDLDHK